MNWEETIRFLRSTAYYKDLLHDSYLDEDLLSNADRFARSEEFIETLHLIRELSPEAKSMLDVGAGNGIATVAFAKAGFRVTALEPDVSETVGSGAIRKLAESLSLHDVTVTVSSAEQMPFKDSTFDIVYVRQAMHHAADLQKFVMECCRVLKPGGMLFTVRDHVVYNETDKHRFLKEHPLHKYYGGENAYTDKQYRMAMESAGLEVIKVLRQFDSIINYFPLTKNDIYGLPEKFNRQLDKRAQSKFGFFAKFTPFRYFYRTAISLKFGGALDEKRIPGRLYSYIARKPKSDA